MGKHIVNGQFQSDKYPWCKPGFVPLKINDVMARDLLAHYAKRRAAVDTEFSDDLLACIKDENEKYNSNKRENGTGA